MSVTTARLEPTPSNNVAVYFSPLFYQTELFWSSKSVGLDISKIYKRSVERQYIFFKWRCSKTVVYINAH